MRNIVSIGVNGIELEFEHRYLISDFEYDLTIAEHSELQRALRICGAYLFEDVRANRVGEFFFTLGYILFV